MNKHSIPASPVVSAYYFPNYHVDTRNAQRHGKGWTEWGLVKRTVPRFGGHGLPLIPARGYLAEADPALMQRKIDAATSHGIGHFIFDCGFTDSNFFSREFRRTHGM